jgi:hypothetical protein
MTDHARAALAEISNGPAPADCVAALAQALDERDLLLQQLHALKQDHGATVAELLHEDINRLERHVRLLRQTVTEYHPHALNPIHEGPDHG